VNVKIEINAQIRELLFELEESDRSKLLFVVCESASSSSRLLALVAEASIHRTSAVLSVREFSETVFTEILSRSRGSQVSAIHLVGFDKVSLTRQSNIFANLNFHRDILLKLNVPLVFWLLSKHLSALISLAPDLWSRRGGVYDFSKTTTRTFLKKLFAQSPAESKKWRPEPILSEAFNKIFASEKALASCLRERESFSLSKADTLINKITSGLDTLSAECNRGRQIEVALWIWNFSHLDAQLQQMLDGLEPAQRSRYESLYTDRNEALLYLSKKLPEIIQRYRGALGANIRKKRIESLLERTRETALSQLARMARALAHPVEMTVPFDPDLELYPIPQFELFETPETMFLQRAARELEEWLVGISTAGPRFLSNEEAELLKLLYMNPGRTALVAKLAKMPVAELKGKLKALETKVSLYLGVSPLAVRRRGSSTPVKGSRTAA